MESKPITERTRTSMADKYRSLLDSLPVGSKTAIIILIVLAGIFSSLVIEVESIEIPRRQFGEEAQSVTLTENEIRTNVIFSISSKQDELDKNQTELERNQERFEQNQRLIKENQDIMKANQAELNSTLEDIKSGLRELHRKIDELEQ